MNDEKTKKRDYETIMQEIWDVKEKIYNEVKEIGFDNYFEYLEKNISHLKERFKDHYVKPQSTNSI